MDVSASAIAELNDKRKFAVAADTYEQICHKSNQPILDAAFHFQGHLAHSMIGGPVEIVAWRLKACPDYDKLMEADLCRDTARQIMRQADRNLLEARELLEKASSIHAQLAGLDKFETTMNWLIDDHLQPCAHYWADQASLARLDYIEKKPRQAYYKLTDAIQVLRALHSTPSSPPEATTYLRNAAFDGVRVATWLQLHRDAAHFAALVSALDPSWKKRLMVQAIRRGGRPVLTIAERFFR